MITDTQKLNLQRLSAYLRSLPKDYDKFNMKTYLKTEEEVDTGTVGHVNVCGTSACAVGHGLAAGILPESKDSTWSGYENFAFGISCENALSGKDGSETVGEEAWYYLFGANNSNCHFEAADRIDAYLNNGCKVP